MLIIDPERFQPPPRLTDAIPRYDQYDGSKRYAGPVVAILEDMDVVSRLQVAALSPSEVRQLLTYLEAWIESMRRYLPQGQDTFRAQ